MDNGRDPDAIDPVAERDPQADSGIEQVAPADAADRSSEEEPSAAACSAATSDALIANSDLDFPSLSAECRQISRGAASSDQPRIIPASAVRS